MTSDNKRFMTDEELDAECDLIMNLTDDELRAKIEDKGLDCNVGLGKAVIECAKAILPLAPFLKSGK